MAITVGSLLVSLGLDSAEFKSGLSQSEKEFRRSTKRMEAIGRGMAGIGRNLTLAVTAPLIALGVTSIKAAAESKDAIGQVEAALRSMGSAAGRTSEQLQMLESGHMRKSLYDDDEILRKVTANLLTFGNIAGDAFDKAQQAAIDLSARLGQDLQSSTLMIGKALNEPVKGLAALRRVGIQFTAQQQEQIKTMAEVGNIAGAQAVMLKELERQFGGAAQAARDANPMAVLQQSFAEFQETVGEKLLPLLPRITDAITRVLDAFGKLSPGMQETVIIAAGLAAVFGPLLILIGSITTALAPFVAGIRLATVTAQAAGVATTGWSVSLATLRATLLTLVQTIGPYVVALGAIGAVIAALIIRHREVTGASEAYRKALAAAEKASEAATAASQRLAMAHGEARKQALLAAMAERENLIQKGRSAQASLHLARAELIAARARADAINQASVATAPDNPFLPGSDQAARAEANLRAASATARALAASLREINAAIRQPEISSPAVAVGGGASDTSSSSSRSTGPTTAEIANRFNNELIGYTQQSLSAMQQLATSSEERADIQMRSVEWARRQTIKQIEADEDYSAAQKAELSAAVERLADYERQGVELQLAVDLEQQRNDLAQVAFDAQREQLTLAGDMADTQAERKRIALQILELEQQYRRNQLEMIVASATALDAEKARAQAILDSLGAIEKSERASVGRSNETDLDRWMREANKSPEQIAEARTGIGIDGLDQLIDGLSRIPGTVDSVKDAFKAMRDVFQSVIQDMLADLLKLQLRKALVGLLGSVLGGVGGGGGGFDFAKAVGTVGTGMPKGFAMGTSFAPGGMALVGERGPELVNLPRGSQVIPNHELAGMRGGDTWNISVNGAMSDRDARRTGQQIASAAAQRQAQARRAGMAG